MYTVSAVPGMKILLVVPSPHWTSAPLMLVPRLLTFFRAGVQFRDGSLSEGSVSPPRSDQLYCPVSTTLPPGRDWTLMSLPYSRW